MARNLAIKLIRTTRANLETQKTASNLLEGEPYFITDESRIAIGTGVNTYEVYAKLSETKEVTGINPQTGTTYTLVLTDSGKLIRQSNASAITTTIPPNLSVAFPVNTVITIEQQGAGQITLAPGSGVTLNALSSGLKSAGQYAGLSIIKVDTNVWTVFGGIA